MSNITPSKPNFTFGYWRPWKKDANAIDSWLDYTKDTQLVKYTAETVGSYISEATKDQIDAINSLAEDVGFLNYDLKRGFEGISSLLETSNERLTNINESLFFINENLEMQLELQRVGNVLLGNIAKLLRVPDSEKQRQHHIELGCKFYTNTVKDEDLFNDSLNEFLAAEKLMPQDYFVLHRIGMIYLFSKNHLNVKLALDYFLKAAKYASVESDLEAVRLANILTQNNYSSNKDNFDDIKENSSIYMDEELIGQLAAESYEKAALCFYILGDFEQAVINAQKAKQLNPIPKHKFKISKYLARFGKSEQAAKELGEAINELPELFTGTFNDLDLLNDIKICKLLTSLDKDKTAKIYELISYLKTTNTLEDSLYINKLKDGLKGSYEYKVAKINEINILLDERLKLSDKINLLLNELKSIDKQKYKNYILNLERASLYSNSQKEQLLNFIKNCLLKEKEFENEFEYYCSKNYVLIFPNEIVKSNDYKAVIESDIFSKHTLLDKWESGINLYIESLKENIKKQEEEITNIHIEINDLNNNAINNKKFENNSLYILIGGMLGGFIITFIYGMTSYSYTNSEMDLNILGMYLTFGIPIIGLVLQRLLYFKKFEKKANEEKKYELGLKKRALESEIKSIQQNSNSINKFNISKYEIWLSKAMKPANIPADFKNNLEKLYFNLSEKDYLIEMIEK